MLYQPQSYDYIALINPRTTDTQWRHKSKIPEKLGRCGRQNMLRPYLKIWEWEWILAVQWRLFPLWASVVLGSTRCFSKVEIKLILIILSDNCTFEQRWSHSFLSTFHFVQIPKRTHSVLSPFHFYHILKRAHSVLSPFYLNHIPKRANSVLSTFKKELILFWAHFILITFQKGYIIFWSNSKKETLYFDHVPKRAHSRAHFILSIFQKEHNPLWAHSV